MRRQAAIGAAGLALVLAACGGGDDPPSGPPPTPGAIRAAEPAPPSERRVRFRAADGKRVEGVFRPAGAAAPAVVLVNGLVGGREQWEPFVPDLREAGFATLAYDGRGGVDVAELTAEVAGAVEFLRRREDVDPRRLAVVGSSVGGATAVLAMTGPDRRRLRAAVAISPPRAHAHAGIIEQDRYRPRDVLFVTDQRERASVEPLTRGATGSRLVVAEEAAHGVRLLESGTVRGAVLDWLERHLR